ncbi:MAG: 1-phosphofructokinase family hexose kinase [Anaerolineales bacterium]|jgi:1-phosphofructokinase family hexose kinase
MIYTFTANPSLDRTLVLKRIALGEYNRGELTHYDLGGKGINVSRNLRSQGQESTLLGFFGGRIGAWLIDDLESQGYRTVPFKVEGESRSNITLIETDFDRLTKLNELGPEVRVGDASAVHRWVEEKCELGDIWVLAGSLPPGLPDTFYADLIEVIQSNGGKTYLDTSGKPLASGWQQEPYFVHGNQDEFAALLNRQLVDREDCIQAVRDMGTSGTEHIVLSRGDQGALAWSGGDIVEAIPPSVVVENAVGAGDAMIAAIVCGHLENWNLERVIRWGVSAGTLSAMQEGTATVDYSDLKAFERRVISCYI